MVGPVRGGIFWLAMEREGEPVCVLTRDEAIPVLDNVVVATVSEVCRALDVATGRG